MMENPTNKAEPVKEAKWVLVDRFGKYLQENEKNAIIWFIITAFYMAVGFFLGFAFRGVFCG